MESSSLALKRLDAETRPLHARADEQWLGLLRPDVTLEDYVDRLSLAYGFVAPYDAALAYLPNLGVRPRARTTLLVRDLLALGKTACEIAKLPMCLEIDPACAASALGWIYVVERSALVHAGLLRHLRHRLPIASASAFLQADAMPFGPTWDELGRALDHASSFEDLLAGARDAFAVQRMWFTMARANPARSYG